MYQLTVYRNCDPAQPWKLRGQSIEGVLDKLRKHLQRYPGQGDGLTIFEDDFSGAMSLIWDECYSGWEIEFDDDPANPECFDLAHDAQERFLALAKDWGEWVW